MLILIASIAIIPFMLAWFYAKNPELIAKRSNYGNLIIPAQPLNYEELLGPPDPRDAGLQDAKGRWILLQLLPHGATCGAVCRETSYATRQIRLMLNKDIARVRRLLLSSDPVTGEVTEDRDLMRGIASVSLVETVSRVLGRAPEEGMLILIDPFANAMMWYPPRFDPYGVLRDLKHLLRSSQIG